MLCCRTQVRKLSRECSTTCMLAFALAGVCVIMHEVHTTEPMPCTQCGAARRRRWVDAGAFRPRQFYPALADCMRRRHRGAAGMGAWGNTCHPSGCGGSGTS
jgi:hypothetical protein